MRPHAELLIRIVREPGAADVRASAARFLAYSEIEGATGVLLSLIGDASTQVKDAVAIGLTFLGRGEFRDVLRSILNRKVSQGKTEAELTVRRSFHRIEDDALIALAHDDSSGAVDLLGVTLLSDLKNLKPATDETQQANLEGRLDRITKVSTFMGRTDNPRAVHWLITAVDLIVGRPDLSAHFDQSELAHSMLKFKEQTRDRIATELTTGNHPAAWVHALQKSRDPYFVPAVHSLFQRKDVPTYVFYYGVLYLWNVGSPDATGVLREAYDSGLMRAEPWHWLRLCEALVANGDGRGLADAYGILVGLKRPAQPPDAEKERRDWQSARDERQREAEAVFGRASKKILTEFLLGKTEVEESPDQKVVLQLLWKLPDLPQPFTDVVGRWKKSADPQVAEMAGKLLKRD